MKGYGADEAGMMPGVIITGINGKETLDYETFVKELGYLMPNETIMVNTLNGTYPIQTKADQQNPAKGLIGIQGIMNERRVKAKYDGMKVIYYDRDLVNQELEQEIGAKAVSM